MIGESHYSLVLDTRLAPLVAAQDHEGIFQLLGSLSNSQFRTAVYMLGEQFAPSMPLEAFWPLFSAMLKHNAKAFLTVMLKALAVRMELGRASVNDEGFASLCQVMNDVDRHKTATFLLPLMKDDAEVLLLFRLLGMPHSEERISYLMKVNTLPCAFVLFSSLRYVEHDRDFLLRVAYFLMKRGDALSFNLASLMKEYFGLEEMKGTFSLRLKPFELARLETSYRAFCDKMG